MYCLVISSSSEYGCSCDSCELFLNLKDAKKALKKEFKSAKDSFDGEISAVISDMFFDVSDYECSYDCVSGKIFKI